MKIKTLRLERFRQFSDTTFRFQDVNLLVGPNNSGKTSVLHAIRAFFLLMHGHVRLEGDPPTPKYHRRFLSSADEIAPAPDLRELWYRHQAGRLLRISATFEDDASSSVVLRQQFGQIHVSAEDLPNQLTSSTISTYFGTSVAFIPGLVGVLVEEPFATAARRNALASQGRYSEIFRSSLLQLNGKSPEAVNKINHWLGDLFDVSVSSISFDMEKDEFVTVKYKQNSISYDVVSSGAGLQQIIQVLTYIYLGQPKILLIDEPDAHLHSKLQARLGDLFKRVAADLEAQLFLSTHSLDLVDTFSTDQVMLVDAGRRIVEPIGSNSDLVSALVEADIIDVSSLSRLLSSRRLVVVEDKNQTILRAFDRALGSPLFSSKSASYVLPAKGLGNFRAVADLGKVISALTGSKFEVTFLQDRDGMPDFLLDPYMRAQRGEGIDTVLLARHEIESYLIEPRLFEAAGEKIGRKITNRAAERAILEAAKEMKAEARKRSRETAAMVSRHIPTQKKPENGDTDVASDKWFDALDFESIDVVRTVFPGKELLKEALKLLNQSSERELTRGQLVACITESHIPPDMRSTILGLAGD